MIRTELLNVMLLAVRSVGHAGLRLYVKRVLTMRTVTRAFHPKKSGFTLYGPLSDGRIGRDGRVAVTMLRFNRQQRSVTILGLAGMKRFPGSTMPAQPSMRRCSVAQRFDAHMTSLFPILTAFQQLATHTPISDITIRSFNFSQAGCMIQR